MGILVSYLKFPTRYSLLTNSVSSLGNQIKNPEGSYIWRLSFILAGIFIIPVLGYVYHALQPIANITSKMYWISAVLASLGVIGVGVFPENKDAVHYIFAFLAFFGFMYAYCCNIYTFAKISKSKPKRYSIIPVIITFLILIISMTGFLTSLILFSLWLYQDLFIINPHLPLWEWIVFLGELFHLLGIFYILFAIEIGNKSESMSVKKEILQQNS